jgi:translation initiation factor 1
MTKHRDNDWKNRTGLVYSTNKDLAGNSTLGTDDTEDIPNERQRLYVTTDRRNRGGKVVTLVNGFIGKEESLTQLGKLLKTKCGVGGSVKDGEIIIQGEWTEKVKEILQKEGFKTR